MSPVPAALRAQWGAQEPPESSFPPHWDHGPKFNHKPATETSSSRSQWPVRALQLPARSDVGLLEPNGTSIIYPALFICRCLFEGEILITQCTELFYRADSWGQGSSPLIAGTKWFKQQPVLQTNPAPPPKSLEQFLIALLPSQPCQQKQPQQCSALKPRVELSLGRSDTSPCPFRHLPSPSLLNPITSCSTPQTCRVLKSFVTGLVASCVHEPLLFHSWSIL